MGAQTIPLEPVDDSAESRTNHGQVQTSCGAHRRPDPGREMGPYNPRERQPPPRGGLDVRSTTIGWGGGGRTVRAAVDSLASAPAGLLSPAGRGLTKHHDNSTRILSPSSRWFLGPSGRRRPQAQDDFWPSRGRRPATPPPRLAKPASGRPQVERGSTQLGHRWPMPAPGPVLAVRHRRRRPSPRRNQRQPIRPLRATTGFDAIKAADAHASRPERRRLTRPIGIQNNFGVRVAAAPWRCSAGCAVRAPEEGRAGSAAANGLLSQP